MDAREALRILAGTDLRLVDAARLAAGLGKRGAVSVSVAIACDRFMRDRKADGVRPDTLRFYDGVLQRFQRAHGNDLLDRVGLDQVEAYLQTIPEGSRRNHWQALGTLYRWAYRQREPLIGEDWTPRLSLPTKRREAEVEFLPVAACQQLLRAARAEPAVLACAALGLFAGIRPFELAADARARLDWSSIDEVSRVIRIPAAVAKTRKARLLENLPPALWESLALVPAEAKSGPVWAHRARVLADRLRKASGCREWPQDGLRHTFATMAVAAGIDLSQVSLWMGHLGNLSILHAHYRGLATKADADRFWKLRP